MADEKSQPKRRSTKRSDPKALFRFIEELSWLLSSYEGTDFKALGKLSDDYMSATSLRNSLSHRATNGKEDALVGVIPGILVDETLFPTNEDIADFAFSLLDISIPRWSKKSKYELIGHIVCHTHLAPPVRRRKLAEALESLVADRDILTRHIARQRQDGASWNEVIQSLVANEYR